MSEGAKDRHVRCYFGILSLAGLMDMKDKESNEVKDYSQVILPIFSTESFKIKTTFNKNLTFPQKAENGDVKTSQHFASLHFSDAQNPFEGDFYQKKFRRDVLWDFGDGTKILGYSAEHSYKKPGRYKITCTFYDINRRTWINDYSIYVVVKEIIPSILRFDDKLFSEQNKIVKDEILCSKIERICRIEALNSNTVKDELKIKGTRIFTEEEHASKHPELSCNYNNLPKATFKHMSKYWTFLENTQTLFYNSDKVHSSYLKSGDLFTPRYTDIYGKFYYVEEFTDSEGVEHPRSIELSLYQIIPYKHIDENLKTIRLLDPNKSILSSQEEHYVDYPITQLFREEQLPQDVTYLGRRGYCDIFYKNDFIRNENILNFIYDVDDKNITGQLKTSTNYLNINPIGFKLNVINNELDKVKIGISLDGFLRDLDEASWADIKDNFYIDPYFYNSLFKGIDIDSYVFPYIPYDEEFYIEGADDLIIDVYEGGVQTYNKMYYVPKDFNIELKCKRVSHKNQGNSSYVNHGLDDNLQDKDELEGKEKDYIQGIKPWFFRVPLVLQDYIDLTYEINGYLTNNESHKLQWLPRVVKFKMKGCDDIYIPHEKQSYEDIDRLIDVYMSHPMFEQTTNLKDAMKAYLGNGFIKNILSSSDNFLDNTANIKTCYLNNLISTLKMMGEDVTEFEKGSFEGINDLKQFVRLLSMNHTDLVGHVIKDEYDINVINDAKGKNVGDEIFIDDMLFIDDKDCTDLGKVFAVKRAGSDVKLHFNNDYHVDLVVVDKYTRESKIVKFYLMQKNLLDSDKSTLSFVRLMDYDESWGWNLLLPDTFKNFNNKISELEKKLLNTAYSRAKKSTFEAEIEVYKKRKGDLIAGYYQFFLLNPVLQDIRVGNFIANAYIDERINDVDSWAERWGVTHDVLMKIYIENCFLKNNRAIGGVYDDGQTQPDKPEYNTTATVNINKVIGQDVAYFVRINEQERPDVSLIGTIHVQGEIEGAGKNSLLVSSDNIILDDFCSFTLKPSVIDVRVNYDGTISQSSSQIKLVGNNLTGVLTVTVSGSVENFSVSCFIDIDFIDERINNAVIFDSSNIHTFIRDYFYTNIRRQQMDSSSVIAGFVDNRNSNANNRKFDVSFSFKEAAKLGKNTCLINLCLNLGKTSYKREESKISYSQSEKFIEIYGHEVEVNIDYNGYISFVDGIHKIPLTTMLNGDLFEGNLYFVLSGNAVLGNHELNCYTYNPQNQFLDNGIKTLLVEIGGYDISMSTPMNGSILTVDELDGFEYGYSARIRCNGQVVGSTQNHTVDSVAELTLYNRFNEPVYTTYIPSTHVAEIDDEGYIHENNFILKINNQNCNGQIVIDVNGGYYDVVGFTLDITLK